MNDLRLACVPSAPVSDSDVLASILARTPFVFHGFVKEGFEALLAKDPLALAQCVGELSATFASSAEVDNVLIALYSAWQTTGIPFDWEVCAQPKWCENVLPPLRAWFGEPVKDKKVGYVLGQSAPLGVLTHWLRGMRHTNQLPPPHTFHTACLEQGSPDWLGTRLLYELGAAKEATLSQEQKKLFEAMFMTNMLPTSFVAQNWVFAVSYTLARWADIQKDPNEEKENRYKYALSVFEDYMPSQVHEHLWRHSTGFVLCDRAQLSHPVMDLWSHPSQLRAAMIEMDEEWAARIILANPSANVDSKDLTLLVNSAHTPSTLKKALEARLTHQVLHACVNPLGQPSHSKKM